MTTDQEIPDHVVQNILTAIAEGERLRTLSNEELCREYLRVSSRGEDDELHTNEMMHRLWPQWANEDL
jgi:hypothetical protein